MARKPAAQAAQPADRVPGGCTRRGGIMAAECGFGGCACVDRFYCSREDPNPRPADVFPGWRFGNRAKDTRCPTCARHGR